jgi:hypothetical protein
MNNRISKKAQHDANKRFADGYRKHCMSDPGIMLNRQHKTADDIATELERRADAGTNVATARGAWQGAILERAKVEAETEDLFEAVRHAVLFHFGNAPDVLADFGLEPRKPRREPTVAEKADAVSKAARTRIARHTMGRRQRLRITGDSLSSEGPEPPAPPEAPARAGE